MKTNIEPVGNKTNIKRHLTDREQDTTKELGKVKTTKLIRKMIKAYNKLCPACRVKAFKNTRRDIGDYCDDCKKMLKEVLSKFAGGNNDN